MEDGFLAAGDMTDMSADLFDHIEDFLEFPNDEDLVAAVDHCPPPPALPLQHQHQHHMPPPSASSSSSQIMMMIPTPVAPAAAAVYGAPPPPPFSTTATTMHDIIFGGGDTSITATAPEHDDHDIAQLEWLSNFFDDSSSDPFSEDLANHGTHMGMNMKMNVSINNNNKSDENGFNGIIRSGKDAMFRACGSPVSVLESSSLVGLRNNCSAKTTTSSSSSSSSSGVGSSSNVRLLAPPHSPPEAMVSTIPARARTKRPRAVSSSRPLTSVSFAPPPPPPAAVSEAEAESFGESDSSPSMATMPVPMMMMMRMLQKKKKQKQQQQQQNTKKRKSPGAAAIATGEEEEGGEAEGEDRGAGPPPVRKCMHCEIQKTPQWRAGPMGPKTLCNACGVRYKSGRLFPEYRPAASPTFIPNLHSNSHKKVVEMRIKASQKTPTIADKESPALKNCDLIEFIRRRD